MLLKERIILVILPLTWCYLEPKKLVRPRDTKGEHQCWLGL
jgi:hypothetical protein